MAIRAEVLRAMMAAGATSEMLIAAVEADQAADEALVSAKRAKAAEKKKRQRARKAEMSPNVPGTQGDIKGQAGTVGDIGGHGSPTPPDGPPPPPAPPPPPLNPPAHSGSDPDGSAPTSGAPSGGEAPADDGDADADEVEPDFRLELFRRGADALRRLTGMSEPRTRALIGSWLGKAGDEAVIVLRLIDEAEARALADPTSWVEAQLRRRRDEQPTPPGPGRRRQAPTTTRDFWAQTARQAHETLTRTTHEQRQSGFDFEDNPASAGEPGVEGHGGPARERPQGQVVRLPAYGDPGRRRAVG